MSEIEHGNRGFIAYEYKELSIDSHEVSMYIDCYKNFGWSIDENRRKVETVEKSVLESGKTVIYLKRDRKMINKAELLRLQRHFEDCIKQIDQLEKSKTQAATAVSIAVGIVGTMFMAGSTFAVVASPPIIWLCVLLAIPGFAGWISPYFIFRKLERKRTEIVTPLIEDKKDEIYEICEKGNALLGE